MLSFLLSTIAFFVAGYFMRRYLDGIGVPKSTSRGLVVFVVAIGVAYAVGFVVDEAAALIH